jgi:hypothetical protein
MRKIILAVLTVISTSIDGRSQSIDSVTLLKENFNKVRSSFEAHVDSYLKQVVTNQFEPLPPKASTELLQTRQILIEGKVRMLKKKLLAHADASLALLLEERGSATKMSSLKSLYNFFTDSYQFEVPGLDYKFYQEVESDLFKG